MTRPIYEPSLQRTDARLNYGQNQLFRRPGQQPDAGTTGIEWVALSSTTNWTTPGYTDLDFSIYSGVYDTSIPTFDTSADDNLLIAKGGVYLQAISVIGANNDGTGTTLLEVGVEISRIAGEAPQGFVHGPWTLLATQLWQLPTFIPVSTGAQFYHWPVFYQNIISYEADQFTDPMTDGPTEFLVQARYLIDGVETAENDVVVRLYVVRFGPEWVDPP